MVQKLTLYVNGASLRAQIAAKNLRQACDEYAPGEFEIDVVDVRIQRQAVRDHNLVALPALISNFPPPVRRIVGDLSDLDQSKAYLRSVPEN